MVETTEPENGQASSAELSALLESKSLILVSGKGGVGKSAVSATLALLAKNIGLKPLLFECDAPVRPSPFPGGAIVTETLQEVTPGIFAVNQDTEEAVRAYAQAAIPNKIVADLLFQNRVSRLFLRAAPSVNEMALVGRIVQLASERERLGPVIVDLHATGHALSTLRAPDGIAKILRGGPVYDRAIQVRDYIFDSRKTAVVTVATPEELPVTEVLEFQGELSEMGIPLGPTVANAVFELETPGFEIERLNNIGPAGDSVLRNLRFLNSWSERSRREVDRLRARATENSIPVVQLPYIFDIQMGQSLASRMAGLLVAS